VAPTVREAVSNTGTATTNVAIGAGTQVDDILICIQVISPGAVGSTHQASPAATTGASAWTTIATAADASGSSVRAWYSRVTTGGAKTVSVGGSYAGSNGQVVAVIVLDDVHPTDVLDGTPTTTTSGATVNSLALSSVTTTFVNGMILGIWCPFNGVGVTPPAGMTELVDRANPSNYASVEIAWESRPVAGATGTRTATGPSTRWSGILIPFKADAFVLNATDSATGADVVTIAPQVGLADSAAGSEQVTFSAQLSAPDSATGTQAVALQSNIGQTENGTGADSATIRALQSTPATDAAAGTETVGITSILNATVDTGTGSETVGLLRTSTIPDTGTGTETLGIGPRLTDSGTGSEEITVREITATRVLPIVPERRYEVTVAARIQQASGAPTFLEVEAVTWLSLAYSDTISAPQDLTLTCQLATLPENVLQHLRRPDVLPFELWVRRDGQKIFAGPLQGWQVQDQKVTIKASGLLQYLAMMGVETDRQFLNADQAVVVKTLVDAWQVTQYGHFGIDTAHMTPTGRLVDQSYVRDELPNLLRAVTDLGTATGGFDIEVDPESRQLTTWSPQRGTDRSEGEDAIVLDTRNVTSSNLLLSIAPADLASDVFATGSKSGGDAPLFSQVSNAELRAKYGRTVTTRSYSNVADQPTLDAYAAAVRDARAAAFIVPGTKVRVTPDADIADYREGDTVSYDLGGELGTSGAFRIRSRTVTVDESGRESVDLEPV
jgi:hypothetical protein